MANNLINPYDFDSFLFWVSSSAIDKLAREDSWESWNTLTLFARYDELALGCLDSELLQ